MNFNYLSDLLVQTHERLHLNAIKTINVNLTVRNWLFGFYIVEFEQNGEDRAKYGKNLLEKIANEIKIKGLTAPELGRCRQFYTSYPLILGTVSQRLKDSLSTRTEKDTMAIPGTLSQELQAIENDIVATPLYPLGAVPPQENSHLRQLLQSASYNHFVELIKIDDPVKRLFYELLILKNTPSVRELRRNIESLTFERFGLSENKEMAIDQIIRKLEPATANDIVKSHYFFEFLNLNYPQLVEEKALEQALLDHLQEFILELGNGFCFEARQKRILIDDEYYFIDLVFYHRVLKCHVLIELKTEHAKYEHIGQLKVYLQYFKKQIMSVSDNPPVGILLVTDKKKTLVEYAVAESDKELFVSKYKLQLPAKKELESFIRNELNRL